MNQTTELSPKQFEALKAIFLNDSYSVMGLSREMKLDRALANNLIRDLSVIEFLSDRGNGHYGVSRKGRDYLIKMKVPGADRKPMGRPKKENDYIDPYDLPPAYTKPKLEIPAEKPDFMALVYRGLSKLNAQLGTHPATIESKEIKVQALNRFADTLSGFDQTLSELLRSVALDLERLGGEK